VRKPAKAPKASIGTKALGEDLSKASLQGSIAHVNGIIESDLNHLIAETCA